MTEVYSQSWSDGKTSLHLTEGDCQVFKLLIKRAYPSHSLPQGKPKKIDVDETVAMRIDSNGIWR